MEEVSQRPEISGMDELNEIDLTNVNTKRTILASGVMKLQLTKIESKPGKPKEGEAAYNNLTLFFKTVDNQKDKDGKEVLAGHTHVETMTLKKTEKFNPFENLARLQECLLGTKGKWNANALIGQIGDVRMGVQAAEGEYEESNRIKSWILKKTGTDAAVPTIG